MASQLDFKVPSWVPKSVQDMAPLLLEHLSTSDDEKAHMVLKRLLTHRDMRHVWRELTKQKRDPRTYRPTGHYYKQESPPLKFLGLTLNSNHLARFFSSAYSYAIRPTSTTTKEEVLELRAGVNDVTEQLEKLAVQFRYWHNKPQVHGQFDTHMWASTLPKGNTLYVPENLRFAHRWTDLNQVADELEKFALFSDFIASEVKPEGPVVQRRTPHEATRAYVLSLASTSKECFGSPLYSVIATTTSVALKKKISPTFVKRTIQRHT